MLFACAAIAAAAAATVVNACGDDHSHAKRIQSDSTEATVSPTVPLVWGDLNVIHTTDSHGWLIGHQKSSEPEPNYSGDFGDFKSFVTHMKAEARRRGVDLLLVDSGDLHDGNGLSDGFPPGGVDGHESNKFMFDLPYDILSIGNHELYIYANTLDMFQNFAPRFPGRYLSSNVNISIPDPHNQGQLKSVPVGSRFAKFHTELGRKVTALGVLYDFTGNSANTTVQPVADMVQEQWFADAIKDEPDFFLLVGHMPVRMDNWPVVVSAIRAVHPNTPLLIFGGHTHIRDCLQPDSRSMALESGRYMETIGWMSADLDPAKKNPTAPITFSRRYLDQNRKTYEFHTSTTASKKRSSSHTIDTFDTVSGLAITNEIAELAVKFNLSAVFGTAPQDYYLSRTAYPDPTSVVTLFMNQVLPVALKAANPARAGIPNFIVANSGSQRFDLLKGPFTRNDQFIVSPFTDMFLYISGVPAGAAQGLVAGLNGCKSCPSKRDNELTARELYARGDIDARFEAWKRDMWERHQSRAAAANLTLGYVTTDDCPGVGDDVQHAPIPFASNPDFVGSPFPDVSDDTEIDLIFVDFIEASIIQVINSLSPSKQFTTSDVLNYAPGVATNTVFGTFATLSWN